jgi:hypothetical protein
VREIMSDGRWRTLPDIDIELVANYDIIARETSISSRIRDLRKPQYGGHEVESKNFGGGLWKYRVKQ